jgi:hypothetical protein
MAVSQRVARRGPALGRRAEAAKPPPHGVLYLYLPLPATVVTRARANKTV